MTQAAARTPPRTGTRRHPLSRWRHAMLAAVVLLHAATSQAGSTPTGCDSLAGQPITFAVDWQADIKPIINDTFGGRCTSCHNQGQPFGGLDLSDDNIDAIYKIVNYTHVYPGRPDLSVLFAKVNCADPGFGARMPAAGNPLTLAQQTLIYDWIAQGAQGEDPMDPIAREFVFRDGSESVH